MRFAVLIVRLAASSGLACAVACGDDGSTAGGGTSTGTDGASSSGAPDPGSTSAASTAADGTSSTGAADGTSSGGSEDGSTGGSTDTGAPSAADPRGYTLFAPLGSIYTYLMDADGLEINRWQSETAPANAAYMLPGGHMMRVARDPDPPVPLVSGAGGIVQEYDWDGNLVWQYEHTGPDIVAHHDIEPMPNGHVLIIAYEMFTVDEAIAAGRDPAEVSPQGLWADFIVEVDPATDQIVWEWHVWDHLVQDFDPAADNYGVVAAAPERIDIGWRRPGDSPRPDWTHTNAVAYDEALDQIILSPRTFSEIWIIDHSTTTDQAASSTGGNAGRGGDLLYRWGNPEAYDAGDANDRQLYFQHNPRWIDVGKPGAGNILIFDNGDRMLRPYSRVVEIVPPLLPDGTYAMAGLQYDPPAPTWIYEDPPDFFAAFISGADRLADGRTLVCSGPTGDLFEVDAAGTVGWTHAIGAQVFRAERYEADHPAWDGLTEEDLVPGDPVMVVPG